MQSPPPSSQFQFVLVDPSQPEVTGKGKDKDLPSYPWTEDRQMDFICMCLSHQRCLLEASSFHEFINDMEVTWIKRHPNEKPIQHTSRAVLGGRNGEVPVKGWISRYKARKKARGSATGFHEQSELDKLIEELLMHNDQREAMKVAKEEVTKKYKMSRDAVVDSMKRVAASSSSSGEPIKKKKSSVIRSQTQAACEARLERLQEEKDGVLESIKMIRAQKMNAPVTVEEDEESLKAQQDFLAWRTEEQHAIIHMSTPEREEYLIDDAHEKYRRDPELERLRRQTMIASAQAKVTHKEAELIRARNELKEVEEFFIKVREVERRARWS
ncbi:hypothetical protein KCU92_g10275, partial [Aureobasidium melanogenum]|jgi:hypothetical protein